jgi:hypothetical protein
MDGDQPDRQRGFVAICSFWSHRWTGTIRRAYAWSFKIEAHTRARQRGYDRIPLRALANALLSAWEQRPRNLSSASLSFSPRKPAPPRAISHAGQPHDDESNMQNAYSGRRAWRSSGSQEHSTVSMVTGNGAAN